jgi:hypothetical protein
VVCYSIGNSRLSESFTTSISKCRYVMGCSISGSADAAAAVYLLDAKAVQMDAVYEWALQLSHALDSLHDDDYCNTSDFGCKRDSLPLGFFMTRSVVCADVQPPSQLCAPSSTLAADAAEVPNFSDISCLSIQCIGLAPLRSPLVQQALYALLHKNMNNLVSLSLRLLPSSVLMPEFPDALSTLIYLKCFSLQHHLCSSEDSARIMLAVARLPQLCSLKLQGLDLSALTSPSFKVDAPIRSIAFRDEMPPKFAVPVALTESGSRSNPASTMLLSHISLVVNACSSTLQALTISGKQAVPYAHQVGSWRSLLHAMVQCLLLQTLDMSRSGIDAVGCVGLACCLRRLPMLLELDVSYNPLAYTPVTPGALDTIEAGAGVHMLAHALKELTSLTSLKIRKCRVNRSGAVGLLQALHSHSSLTQLAIGGTEYSSLPNALHELLVISEGLSRMSCTPCSASEYDASLEYAKAFRAVYSEGVSEDRAMAALRAALVPVNMCVLAPQLLQPSLYLPPDALPQLLMHVIGSNSTLTSLHLADLCVPIETLPLLASAWQQLAMPPIIFGDFRCRVDASAGRARQVAGAWTTVMQAAAVSYERRGMRMPRTLRWPPFQGAGAPQELVK